ncbi:uncharacterized protein LOC134930666 [Pseudophryne corroboree]
MRGRTDNRRQQQIAAPEGHAPPPEPACTPPASLDMYSTYPYTLGRANQGQAPPPEPTCNPPASQGINSMHPHMMGHAQQPHSTPPAGQAPPPEPWHTPPTALHMSHTYPPILVRSSLTPHALPEQAACSQPQYAPVQHMGWGQQHTSLPPPWWQAGLHPPPAHYPQWASGWPTSAQTPWYPPPSQPAAASHYTHPGGALHRATPLQSCGLPLTLDSGPQQHPGQAMGTGSSGRLGSGDRGQSSRAQALQPLEGQQRHPVEQPRPQPADTLHISSVRLQVPASIEDRQPAPGPPSDQVPAGALRDEGQNGAAEMVNRTPEASGTDYQAGLARLARKAVAPRTLRTYEAAFSEWQAFRIGKGEAGKNAREELLEYVWQGYSQGRSKAAMSATLAGIAYVAKLRGEEDPTKSFLLSKALKGWAREQATPGDARRPIGRPMLKNLIEVVSRIAADEYETGLFRLAFSLAFLGAFRVGELVASSKSSKDSGLMAGNVAVEKDRVLCKIHKSKTDQLGRGRWVTIGRQEEQSTCAVTLASDFERRRPQGPWPQWLVHDSGSPLTRFQFQSVFKKGLRALQLPVGQYGTHSFRIGAATCAEAEGLPASEIKKLGRWKSGAYKVYLRTEKHD